MLRLPIFGKKKLLLALEYGVIISQVAQKQEIELTTELVKRAEEMLVNEFRNKSTQRLAVEMIPNVLSVFETN